MDTKSPICHCGHDLNDHGDGEADCLECCAACDCPEFNAIKPEQLLPPGRPADATPSIPPSEALKTKVTRTEFKEPAYNWLLTWLRRILGIEEDRATFMRVAQLMNSNCTVLMQLGSGIRRDLEAAIQEGINPTSDIALSVAHRIDFYEKEVATLIYAREKYDKELRKQAMRLEAEHPTTPLPETPVPTEIPERRGFDANGVAVPRPEVPDVESSHR